MAYTAVLPIERGGTGATTAADALIALGAAASADVLMKSGGTMSGAINMGTTNRITNLADGAAATDAATVGQIQTATAGITAKTSCKAATTAAIATAYTGGGTSTLTNAGAKSAFALDDVTLVQHDRVLIKNEPAAGGLDINNGIWQVETLGSGAVNWVLKRVTDFDTGGEANGVYTFISDGTVNGLKGFICTTDMPYAIDTDPLAFTEFSAVPDLTEGNGIDISAGVISLTGLTSDWAAGAHAVVANNVALGSAANTFNNVNDAVADANPAANFSVHAANKTAGTGAGGNLNLAGGTSAGGAAGVVQIADATAPTKLAKFDLSGATAGTATTLSFLQTGNVTIAFPNASDTLVGKATTDDLTNKTLMAPKYGKCVKSAAYTLALTDGPLCLFTNTSGAAYAATLPTAASASGLLYSVKNVATSTKNVILTPNGAEKIDDEATQTLMPGDALDVYSDGTTWHII